MRIPRARTYSGSCRPLRSFGYKTLTFFGWASHLILLSLQVPFTVRNPKCISTLGLASFAFARHYSQNLGWFLFLCLLRCFSSAGSLDMPMYSAYRNTSSMYWVSSFGHPRIEAYLQLPVAYRSLSRPSSAPSAKAFSLRSFSLELSLISVLFFNYVSFANRFCCFLFRYVVVSLFQLSERLIFVFIDWFVLFCLLDLFFSIRFSMYILPIPPYLLLLSKFGRPKWTRTTDLVLIRHAL